MYLLFVCVLATPSSSAHILIFGGRWLAIAATAILQASEKPKDRHTQKNNRRIVYMANVYAKRRVQNGWSILRYMYVWENGQASSIECEAAPWQHQQPTIRSQLHTTIFADVYFSAAELRMHEERRKLRITGALVNSTYTEYLSRYRKIEIQLYLVVQVHELNPQKSSLSWSFFPFHILLNENSYSAFLWQQKARRICFSYIYRFTLRL